MQVTTGQLAKELGVTPARVSQLVGEGKLDGTFSGEGRARRFDLRAAAQKLGRTLDAGQLLGNGAATKRAIERIAAGEASVAASRNFRDGGELPGSDPDRYEMARTQKAEEEARRLRRQNAEAEGTLVLAAEVDRRVAQTLGQELAQVEAMLRQAARSIADELGVDARAARQCLIETWRAHRQARSDALVEAAAAASMTDDERAADI